jgi:hypothetical protein
MMGGKGSFAPVPVNGGYAPITVIRQSPASALNRTFR